MKPIERFKYNGSITHKEHFISGALSILDGCIVLLTLGYYRSDFVSVYYIEMMKKWIARSKLIRSELIPRSELMLNTFRSGIKGMGGVVSFEIKHLPTGLKISGEPEPPNESEKECRERLIKDLSKLVYPPEKKS